MVPRTSLISSRSRWFARLLEKCMLTVFKVEEVEDFFFALAKTTTFIPC